MKPETDTWDIDATVKINLTKDDVIKLITSKIKEKFPSYEVISTNFNIEAYTQHPIDRYDMHRFRDVQVTLKEAK